MTSVEDMAAPGRCQDVTLGFNSEQKRVLLVCFLKTPLWYSLFFLKYFLNTGPPEDVGVTPVLPDSFQFTN